MDGFAEELLCLEGVRAVGYVEEEESVAVGVGWVYLAAEEYLWCVYLEEREEFEEFTSVYERGVVG